MTDVLLPTTIEQKYVFPDPHKTILLDWLESFCVRDPKFYRGVVSSLYYDTPTFALYDEKRNSDYTKTKVRLRWYGAPTSGADSESVSCFLEVKQKQGSIRHKQRVAVTLPAQKLVPLNFADEEMRHLPRQLFSLIAIQSIQLQPMLVVQYQRHRFIDPQTRARISLDTQIQCPCANPDYFVRSPSTRLSQSVLEIKYPGFDLPEILKPLQPYVRKDSFSKYAQCYEQLMNPIAKRV